MLYTMGIALRLRITCSISSDFNAQTIMRTMFKLTISTRDLRTTRVVEESAPSYQVVENLLLAPPSRQIGAAQLIVT